MYSFSFLDWAALGLWGLVCLGYGFFAERVGDRRPNLMASMARFRRTWMREAYLRDARIADVGLIGNLMQSATFFSSTTLLVIGASFALMGTIERSVEVVELMRKLPFGVRVTQELIEAKLLVLTLVLVYAFFRFSWSLRQFNLVNIVIGAFPSRAPGDAPGDAPDERLIRMASRLNELAGLNFTQGLRAYYYAVPLLLWIIDAWLLVAGTLIITLVLCYMEFRSATVSALAE
ncbi:MAG TPA: DUF599 domain-containing protein [Burkholderiaceae bacterium]|nr:DUF599 domain-containing protein [Burkholderiaceae bacterium]